MKRINLFTKVLVIVGTLLVWLPVIAPILFSLGAIIGDGILRFDYLIPAELFPMALVGSLLLLWGARRAQNHGKLIGLGIIFTIVTLIGGQIIASITGLASGEIEPTGWLWILVLGSIMLYILALVVIGIGGLFLLRDLFLPSQKIIAN